MSEHVFVLSWLPAHLVVWKGMLAVVKMKKSTGLGHSKIAGKPSVTARCHQQWGTAASSTSSGYPLHYSLPGKAFPSCMLIFYTCMFISEICFFSLTKEHWSQFSNELRINYRFSKGSMLKFSLTQVSHLWYQLIMNSGAGAPL